MIIEGINDGLGGIELDMIEIKVEDDAIAAGDGDKKNNHGGNNVNNNGEEADPLGKTDASNKNGDNKLNEPVSADNN